MQHFQSILIIIGVIAILAVLIHGYLIGRKENIIEKETNNNIEEGIVGEVRIIRAEDNEVPELNIEDDDKVESASSEQAVETAQEEEAIIIAPQDVEPIILDHVTEDVDQTCVTVSELPEVNEPTEEIIETPIEILTEAPEIMTEKEPTKLEQQHFIFNIAAKPGNVIHGNDLLQFFITAGFRFGEMSIFHRHLHANGMGPILFSIANMRSPGTMDPEEMKLLTFEGLSFFLTVPNNEINIKNAFDMMFVAIEQMVEEFDCIVLDDQHNELTEEIFRTYNERLLRYI